MNDLAVATVERGVEATPAPGLGALRGELAGAGAGAREQVMIDFLEDDLRAAEEALEQLRRYVGAIGATLRSGRAGRGEPLALARTETPDQDLDELQATVAGLRRRLLVVAARLPR